MALDIVILAAGYGKRMCSKTPKVLHKLGGQPLIERVIASAKALNPTNIFVIYGQQGERVKTFVNDESVTWVHQAEQLGTGHAVLQALEYIDDEHTVLVLSADVPLLSKETLQALATKKEGASVALLTATFDNPFGLGRIIRNEDGEFLAIVEEKDASVEEKSVKEIYSGVMLADAKELKRWLPKLTANNAQKELYLTSIVEMAVKEELAVASHETTNLTEVKGVNTRAQLHELERAYQQQTALAWMDKGVGFADINRVDFRGDINIGEDTFIDVNVVFEGQVTIESGVVIEPNCVIRDSVIKKDAVIKANSHIDNAEVGLHAEVGPFARLRPGTTLGHHSKVGNFVEVKKSTIGAHSKASHLSYVGDALIGEHVNIGAGTITCNYDGVKKHQTVIDDGVFIGSGTELVAPIHIGENATIGAGTTLRRNAPPEKLTLTQAVQKTLDNWQRREK